MTTRESAVPEALGLKGEFQKDLEGPSSREEDLPRMKEVMQVFADWLAQQGRAFKEGGWRKASGRTPMYLNNERKDRYSKYGWHEISRFAGLFRIHHVDPQVWLKLPRKISHKPMGPDATFFSGKYYPTRFQA
jgi:hypothetical protein